MGTIRGDQLRGHLDGLILASLERGEAHGWDILRNLETASGGMLALKEGSLYPALYRLEGQGLLAARWDETAERPGPRRRVYRLTGKGRRRLAAARDEWRAFVSVLGSLLGALA
ncbi:MAG TPA: helix-turn-helix transcriptional regulator [Pirellulales bacterium]|nr:helix-turn-helix transcriptional regulator [Pirellulales bacterium]